jgi:magnesium-transporting ATPase (P-type)
VLLLLATNWDKPRDHCYIETSSLDGESNLKLRTACFTADRHAPPAPSTSASGPARICAAAAAAGLGTP